MLRPEQMSKVSITGSKSVMADVIATVHELRLLHLSEYDGSWLGFDQGNSMEGADEVSEKLVTVRSLESILDVKPEDAGRIDSLSDEDIESKLETVRREANELDDRRVEIGDELRSVDDELDRMEPFAALGLDLDLLSGYDSLAVAVGEGDADAVEAALDADANVEAFDLFTGDGVVAAFVYADDSEAVLDDALVGVDFAALDAPDASGRPAEYIEDLERRKHRLERKLETIENELEDLKLDAASFLLAVEEQLTIDAQKREAPLSFATTDRSFIAEGWVPSEQFAELERAVVDTVGDRVEIEELQRLDHREYAREHDHHGHGAEEDDHEAEHEDVVEDQVPTSDDDREREVPAKAAANGGAASGGQSNDAVVTMDDEPPVVQDNPGPVKPFETLVNAVNRPKYGEIDPTFVVFLTFPLAFGFMIGDIGYGLLYMGMGWFLLRYESDAINALGWVAIWAGLFTTLFGYLYDDFFGVHMADAGLHLPLAGSISKGLQSPEFALLWVVVCILFGLLHLNTAFVLGFFNDRPHGILESALENFSWILALNGFFVWVFSTHLSGQKPDFLVGPDSVLAEFVGFAGFSEPVGLVGLAAFAISVVIIPYAEGVQGAIEIPTRVLAHSMSYLRMVAVLLAKAGMAFVVNLLVFGAYIRDGKTYFGLPGTGVTDYPADFVGLIHMDPLAVTLPLAVIIFVLGHILVLLLGITAAGIQMIRLEYVEFFEKFYEGGGEKFQPFGYRRT